MQKQDNIEYQQNTQMYYAPPPTAGVPPPVYSTYQHAPVQPQHIVVATPPPPPPQQPAFMMPMYLVPGTNGQQQLVGVMNVPSNIPHLSQTSMPIYQAHPGQALAIPTYLGGGGNRAEETACLATGVDHHRFEADKRNVVAAMICYILGFFFWAPQLASIIISLHQSRRGFFSKNNAAIIALGICELIAWMLLPSLVWGTDTECYQRSYWSYGSYHYYTQCSSYWWGWIAFTVWGPMTIAFGIPRIILSFRQLKITYGEHYANSYQRYGGGYN